MRARALLFLLVGAARPQDSAKPENLSRERIHQLVEQLAEDDVVKREEATATLQRAGEQARKELEEASRSSNHEQAGRAGRLLWTLDRMRVSIKVDHVDRVSKEKPIPAEVRVRNAFPNTGGIYCKLGFEVTVWLLELYEEPLQEGRHHHGSFTSRGSSGCTLSESDFLKLTPGSEHTICIDDLRTHWEFQISEKVVEKYPKISLEAPTLAGRYRIVATYGYDRVKYIADCNKGCPKHSDPEATWNRCIDQPLRAEAEFVIR